MDNRQEVSEFLTTRRARITPDQVGLPTTGARRVPGLRRSEVAALAGLSVEYYARLGRGQIAGASSGVLEALARALQLDETNGRTSPTSLGPPTGFPPRVDRVDVRRPRPRPG